MTNVSKSLPQDSSETIENEIQNIETDRQIPKERNISKKKGNKLLMT